MNAEEYKQIEIAFIAKYAHHWIATEFQKDLKEVSIAYHQAKSKEGAGEKYGKLWSDEDGHDYIIPESMWEEFCEFVDHLTGVGCQGETSDAYYYALGEFEKLYGGYMIDGDERDYRIVLPPRLAAFGKEDKR